MCGKLQKVVLFLQLSVLLVLSRPQSFVGAISYTSELFRLLGDESGPRNNHKDLHYCF